MQYINEEGWKVLQGKLTNGTATIMSYINLKRKALVVILCLMSFTVGCFLTSQLGTRKLLERPRDIVPLGLQDWSQKWLRAQRLQDTSGKITGFSSALREKSKNRDANVDENIEILAYEGNETKAFDDDDDYWDAAQQELHTETPVRPAKPAKYNYFVEVKDPRASMILEKVVNKLPDNLKKSVVLKNGLLTSGQFSRLKGSTQNVQKKWALLIESMKKFGYEQRLPVIINIGVKKSGTNAFGFFISQHPQIVHSIGNEVHYFDWNYDKDIEYYRSRMSFSKANQFSFEKTPRYFVTKDAPKNILKDLPGNLKFVICVRDPVARAISDFRHEAELKLRRDNRDRRAIHAEANAETGESQGKLFEQSVLDSSGQVNASFDAINTSIYSKHFKNWLEYFPRDHFYILSDERVNKDIYTEMKNVEKFLGLEPFYEKSMFYFNDVIHAPCMHVTPRPCPAKSTPGILPKAEPSPEVIQKLRDFYRPFNQEFEELSQMKYSWTNL